MRVERAANVLTELPKNILRAVSYANRLRENMFDLKTNRGASLTIVTGLGLGAMAVPVLIAEPLFGAAVLGGATFMLGRAFQALHQPLR